MEFVGKTLLVEIDGKQVLVIGDLHLGYEEALNQIGIFVTRTMYDELIEYFDRVFEKVGKISEVVLLGDVKHSFGNINGQEWEDILGFLDYLKGKCGKIIVVRGNHDVILDQIVGKKNVEVVNYYHAGDYFFMHGHEDFIEAHGGKVKHWIMGHAHPSVKLGDGTKVEKFKCFLEGEHEGKKVTIVPSFFNYYEGSDPRESYLGLAWNFDLNKFNVKIVSGDKLEVLEFGELGKLD